MIAISSYRADASGSAMDRVLKACASWRGMFSAIVYVGDFAARQDGIVSHVRSEDWPPIKLLAQMAALHPLAAIINADIVVGERLAQIPQIMHKCRIGLCSSRRRNLETGEFDSNDKGRDIFIGTGRVWGRIAREIPPQLRIGHQQWDAWMISWGRKNLGKGFSEFSNIPCIYHPPHGDRKMPYQEEVNAAIERDPYKEMGPEISIMMP